MSIDESAKIRTVHQAHQHILGMVHEIAALAEHPLTLDEFCSEYLDRVVSALGAVAGVVWMRSPDGTLIMQSEREFSAAGLTDHPADLAQHERLAHGVLTHGRNQVVAPGARAEAGSASNPTEYLLLLAPVRVAGESTAVVEIVQRPQTDMNTQRNYLSFLAQTCEKAADFLRNHRLRQLAEAQGRYRQMEEFARAVHASLEVRTVAYTVANEARRLLGCDRASVAILAGRECRVRAVSGQDSVEPRANAVRLLNALATRVVASGDEVWYAGDTRDLAAPIETALQAYIDESHAQQVVIVPLRPPQIDDAAPHASMPVGALAIERLADPQTDTVFAEQLRLIAGHSASALANACQQEQVFLLPLWRAVGRSQAMLQARTLPKLVVIGGALLVTAALLLVIPKGFHVTAPGTLLPAERRHVFTSIDGTVERVLVNHGDKVQAGQLLLELRNTDFEVSATELAGQRTAAQEQLRAIERALFDENRRLNSQEKDRLSSQMHELNERIANLDRQQTLFNLQREKLRVVSPLTGEVTTWNVQQLLDHRPVRQGQILLNVADTSADWELELRLPENRVGHLVQEQRSLDREHLRVTFRLATEPGVNYEGEVVEVHRAAEARSEDGASVLVRVKLDPEVQRQLRDSQLLRSGAGVVANVDCGTRSLGFVWFHDLVAWAQTKLFSTL